jgi:hypothetical protein
MVDLLEKIDLAEISSVSKETYKKISRSLVKSCTRSESNAKIEDVLNIHGYHTINDALYDIIKNVKKYQPIISSSSSNPKSLSLYYSTIKALIKHSGDVTLQEYKKEWEPFAKDLDDKVREDIDNHIVGDRQKNGALKWVDILITKIQMKKMISDSKDRETKKRASMDYLLLCTYVAFTRRQVDYASVRLYKNHDDKIEDVTYIHLNPSNNKKPYIHIGVGKTSKHYGDFECELPKDMLESLKVSLRLDPREYLFGNKTAEGFRQWCNNTLKRIFKNKHVTVNSLRHAHAEYIDNTPKIKLSDRKKEAWKMGHSVMKQLEYNLNLNNRGSDPPAETEECYRLNPETKKLEKGDCIFIEQTSRPLKIIIPK